MTKADHDEATGHRPRPEPSRRTVPRHRAPTVYPSPADHQVTMPGRPLMQRPIPPQGAGAATAPAQVPRPAPPAAPLRPVPARPAPAEVAETEAIDLSAVVGALPRAIVVAGTVGAAGATTLAVLLGAVLAEQEERKVLLLDAAPAGGDLSPRVFSTTNSGQPWEDWARAGANPAVLQRQLGEETWGTAILGAEELPPDAGRLLYSLIETVTAQGWIVVVDAGSGAVGSPVLSAAIAADAALVLAIPQRVEGANRARLFLSRLARRHGFGVVRDAVVAVSDHGGRQAHVFRAVADGLADKVSGVIRIPSDRALSTGRELAPRNLRQPTTSAVSLLIEALTATRAAIRRPAR